MNERNDPFRHIYDGIEKREFYVFILFYVTTALSIFATFRDDFLKKFPIISPFDYDLWISFTVVLASLFGFLLSICNREYSFPNAEEKRVKDNLTNAFCVPFGQERTIGYYNNQFQNPDLRNAANTLENIFFTKEILSVLLKKKAFLLSLCIVIFVYVAFIANVPKIVVAFQFLISEPIISSGIKMFFLRQRCDKNYDLLIGIFTRTPDTDFRCKSAFSFTAYEMAKARAGIVLPSKMFDKINPALSEKWRAIIKELSENISDAP